MEHKLALLEKYLETTKKMIQALDAEDFTDSLDAYFDEREQCIAQINALSKQAHGKDARVTSLLEKIKAKDLQLNRKLLALKEEAAQQLYLLRQAKEVKQHYYVENEQQEAVFYDKKL